MVRIIDNYTLFEVVGEGSYGKVYRAINKLDKKQYAVKVIQAKKFYADKKLEQYTVNQINILSNIEKNPHIIGYYDMLKSQTNFYFVYEFCNGGTLQNLLNKQKKLPQEEALKIFKQLLIAFKLLYKFHVMHRDLKPDNILFKEGVVKLGDFGFCKNIQKTKMTKTMLGSPVYMAPQILKGQIYSSKADIWSLGVVLFEMLYGYCPFQSSSIPKLLKIVQSTDVVFPSNVSVSNDTKNLINRILTKNPKYRIQWDQLFQIKINDQGKIITQKNKLGISLKQRKASWITEKQDHFAKTVSNKSLQKYDQVTPKFKRQKTNFQLHPMTTTNLKTLQKNIPDKGIVFSEKKILHTVQEDTDDQSHKNKLFKRQKGFARVRTINNFDSALDENLKTTGNFKDYLKKVQNTLPEETNYFANKQKVVIKHSEIIQGNSIARNLQCVNQKHATLFSQFIYQIVIDRLIPFSKQLRQYPDYSQILQLVNGQIEELKAQLSKLQKDCPQGAKILQTKDYNQIKKVLKQKIPQCRHLRLCYQLVMFIINQPVCSVLKNDEMSKIINLKLVC